ncbi:MAG: serine/threonine-protein kinase [Vicinamibacteria bacterium]
MPTTATAPQVLDGKYRLEQVLGRGGMGVVRRAIHLGTTRTVAVKLIAPRFGADAEFLERFRREAAAAGRLRHPNVVDVTDFGFAETSSGPVAYLVMEYLDGCSLEEVLRQEARLPARFVADVMEQVASAVSEAHANGIVHRDLKPSNLWLEPDRRGGYNVKVLDFGLAKLADPPAPGVTPTAAPAVSQPAGEGTLRYQPPAGVQDDADPRSMAPGGPAALEAAAALPLEEQDTRLRPDPPASAADAGATSGASTLTRVGSTLGTPLYMSPEQCRGGAVDARTDVYSMGVIAFRMLAGRAPFEGSEIEIIRGHLGAAAPELRSLAGSVPRGVSDLVMSALAKEPASRPQTAAAFAAALSARAEGAASILQQMLALYVGHFGPILRLMALSLAPFVCLSVLLGLAAATGLVGGNLQGLLMLALMLEFLGGLMFATPLYCPVVAQLLIAPLRPVRLRPLLRAFRSRLAPYAAIFKPVLAFIVYILVASAISALLRGWLRSRSRPERMAFAFVAVGLPILLYLAWFLRHGAALRFSGMIVLMEGLGTREALERSRQLVDRTRRALSGFEMAFRVVTLPMVALGGVLGWLVTRGGDSDVRVTIALLSAPLWCLPLAVALPLPLVGSALLYFKARQALGEPLTDVLADFERRALPPEARPLALGERIRIDASTRG